MKAGVIIGLLVVLLFAWLMVKLALIRTMILYGGTLFMVGVLLFIAALAITFLAVRSRRARA